MSSGLYETTWSLETSEETSVAVFASVSTGKLYFVDESSGEKLVVKYRCIAFGHGKGLPVGANWSKTTDPSGDVDNVIQVKGRTTFSPFAFPCYGYMIGMGASAGVVGSIMHMDVTGGGLTIAFFGAPSSFAAIRLWGFGRGALPGVGIGAGLASFSVDDA